MDNQTPSDRVAQRIGLLLKDRKMTARELAARCAQEGMPGITAQVIYKLVGQRDNESRPRRPVTVDELFVLARALDVPVADLLPGVPITPPEMARQFAALLDKFADDFGTIRVQFERALNRPGK